LLYRLNYNRSVHS